LGQQRQEPGVVLWLELGVGHWEKLERRRQLAEPEHVGQRCQLPVQGRLGQDQRWVRLAAASAI
jgi:hypothetical protein